MMRAAPLRAAVAAVLAPMVLGCDVPDLSGPESASCPALDGVDLSELAIVPASEIEKAEPIQPLTPPGVPVPARSDGAMPAAASRPPPIDS